MRVLFLVCIFICCLTPIGCQMTEPTGVCRPPPDPTIALIDRGICQPGDRECVLRHIEEMSPCR